MLSFVLAAGVIVGVMEASTTPRPEPPKCCFDKEFSAILGENGGVFDVASNTLNYLDVSVCFLL